MDTNEKFDMIIKQKEEASVGAWKFVVLIGLIFTFVYGSFCIISFGIIYGDLIEQIGYGAQDISTISSVFTMVLLCGAVPANQLLKRMTYRKAAFVAATTTSVGAFLSPFVTSSGQLIFTLSVLQGIGWGTITAICFVVFAEYFRENRTFFLNSCHLSASLISLAVPYLSMASVKYYGSRATILLTAALSLNLLLAALSFQPVRWHLKSTQKTKDVVELEERSLQEEESVPVDFTEEPQSRVKNVSKFRLKGMKFCWFLQKEFDLHLLKDLVFINVSIGASVFLATHLCYISFLPMILLRAEFLDIQMATLVTITLAADLIGRSLLCVLTAFVKVKLRYLILYGCSIQSIFYLAQTFNRSFGWNAFVCCVLGLVRCLLENNVPMVFAEMYPDKFASVLSLNVFVGGSISLLLGQILKTATNMTDDVNIILIILSVATGCCIVLWIIELCGRFLRTKLRNI